MAQLVERVLGKDEVAGSNPASSSIKDGYLCVFVFIFYLNLPKSENKEFLMRYFFRLAFLL